MSDYTVIHCLCCHQNFQGIRELNQHRGPNGEGTDEGETWVASGQGWSHA